MPPRAKLRCTFLKACHAKWLVLVMGYTQTQASHIVGVNVGSVFKWPDKNPSSAAFGCLARLLLQKVLHAGALATCKFADLMRKREPCGSESD